MRSQSDYIETNDAAGYLAERGYEMRSRNAALVREFRTAFGKHVAAYPTLAPTDDLKLHHKLIGEEVSELYAAIQERDAEEVLDALGDILYLVYGCAIDCGFDLDAAVTRIHEANMAKLVDGRVVLRDDGKILKPDGWKPPILTDLV